MRYIKKHTPDQNIEWGMEGGSSHRVKVIQKAEYERIPRKGRIKALMEAYVVCSSASL